MSENDLKMTQEKWECELMEEQVEQMEEKLVQLKKDLSEAEADLVKVVGRVYAAHAVTGLGHFTRIKK